MTQFPVFELRFPDSRFRLPVAGSGIRVLGLPRRKQALRILLPRSGHQLISPFLPNCDEFMYFLCE